MVRPKTDLVKDKFIKIRVSGKLYNFIKDFSQEMGISVSELCRTAIQNFFMALLLGKMKNVDKEFFKKFSKVRK